MSVVTIEIIITNVVNSMMSYLDREQLAKLKGVLYMQLRDADISKRCYELSTDVEEGDAAKLTYFENSLRMANKSEGTIDQYLRTVKAFRNYIHRTFDQINPIDIKAYLAYGRNSKGWKDTTLTNNKNYLSAFFSFLYKEEFIPKNPMLKIEAIKQRCVVKSCFTKTEMEKLRNAGRGHEREMALIELLVSSGIRVNECSNLNWCDLNFQTLRFKVQGKGNKEREVLFNERASFHLQKYLEHRIAKEGIPRDEMLMKPIFTRSRKELATGEYIRLNNDGIRNVLKTLGEQANVIDVHPHKFRRTFATDCINRGMPIEELKVLMGHNQIETTLQYVTLNNATIDNTYRKLCA